MVSKYELPLLLAFAALLAWGGSTLGAPKEAREKHLRYVARHLEDDAVSPYHTSFAIGSGYQITRLKFPDEDNDGLHESVLPRPNTDGTLVDLVVQKVDGKLHWPTLAATAIDPLNVPKWMRVDYVQNEDGLYESVAHMEFPSVGRQTRKVDVVNNRIQFSDVE